MAKIIGLTHTDGRIVRVNQFSIKGSDVFTGSPQNDGLVEIRSFVDTAQETRYLENTLTEFEVTPLKMVTVTNVLDKLTQYSDGTLTDGERIRELVYQFVKTKLGVGWDYELET